MITRFSVLPDERRLLLGIDKANLFKAGVVYEARELLGEIILRPVGKYSLPKCGPSYPNEYSEANAIICDGSHLITVPELNSIILRNND